MNLPELKEFLLINTNQYFIGQKNIEIKDEVLVGLIKRALMYYQNHKPKFYRKYNLEINDIHFYLKQIDGRTITNIINLQLIDPVYGLQKIDGWKYDINNNILYISNIGIYVIDCMVKPSFEDIDYDDELFLDMMIGLYLMYIAEVRKGFKLNDLPFDNDAESLWDYGKELFDNTRERLEEQDNTWYLAIR